MTIWTPVVAALQNPLPLPWPSSKSFGEFVPLTQSQSPRSRVVPQALPDPLCPSLALQPHRG